MVQTKNLEESDDINFDWTGIISAATYGIHSAHNTTLKVTLGQLIFGQDMIFNIKHAADLHLIK